MATSFHFGLFVPCMSLPNAGVIAESVGVGSVLPVDLEGESLGILVRLLKMGKNKRRHYKSLVEKPIETREKILLTKEWFDPEICLIQKQKR